MFKFLRENFNITNDCIILATPMVVFFIFTQWYIHAFQDGLLYNYQSKDLVPMSAYIAFFVTLWVWISGCFSGWFYMVKKTLQYSGKTFLFDKDRNNALINLLYCLIKGVGKFFIAFLILVALYFILKLVKVFLLLDFFYISSVYDINYTLISLLSIFLIFTVLFFLLYVIPEIVYYYVNPFRAIINSIKKICLSYKEVLPIYLILITTGFILNFSFVYFANYPILYFFLLLFSYYYLLYFVILVFRLYEKKFV